jgi:transposase-like protein
MARSSHQACSVCRVRIHKRNRYGLCPQHYEEHELKLRIERAAARQRRASKVTNPIEIVIDNMQSEQRGAVIKAEVEARQNGAKPVPARRVWTDEMKLEVGSAYEDLDTPIADILTRFEIGEGTLYAIVRGLGLQTRNARAQAALVAPPPEVADELPAPQVAALERMLVPPAREPLAQPTPRARQAPVPSSLSMAWTVKVEGLITVEADDIAEALRIVKQGYPNLRISGINESG